ncbi:DUF998 domain-containing protein [Thermococcus sp.]|uniref:DUF998 domain-containing protein n=1 Tax=Thermococcus sp. TaxID=35749 RepID=UPI00262431C8|nr:DUF998 domain-containing protein [Thermococcus sp.]
MNLLRVAPYIAVSLPLVFFLSLTFIIVHNPWFSLQNNAFSDMGSLRNPTRWYFNGFLMGFAVLAFIPAYAAFRNGLSYLMPLALVFLFLVGVFPEELPYHAPSAVLFYLLALADIAIVGFRLGGRGLGLGYLWSAMSLVTLLSMLLIVKLRLFRGLAIPELVGAVFILSWFVFLGGLLSGGF